MLDGAVVVVSYDVCSRRKPVSVKRQAAVALVAGSGGKMVRKKEMTDVARFDGSTSTRSSHNGVCAFSEPEVAFALAAEPSCRFGVFVPPSPGSEVNGSRVKAVIISTWISESRDPATARHGCCFLSFIFFYTNKTQVEWRPSF